MNTTFLTPLPLTSPLQSSYCQEKQSRETQTLKSIETRENQEKHRVPDEGQVQDLQEHLQDVQEQLQDHF